MPDIKKLEQQLAALDEKRKKARKELSDAKRREKAKELAAYRRQQQADALAFVEFCKVCTISEEPDAPTIYDWVKSAMSEESGS